MSKIQIMTDSASDISYADEQKYCISVIPFPITLGDNALYGSPVVHAAKLCVDGAKVEEILQYLTDILPRRQIYLGIYDLKYAAKSGRIPTAAAFLGTKMNLKPVMKIADCSITTAAKCRGERKLVEKIAEMSIADMEPGTPYENDVPIPKIGDHDVLIRVKAAAVNPVDILNLTGAVRLIQDYQMPLTLGNECAGIVEKAGKFVTRFKTGDRVYSRVPISTNGKVIVRFP